MDIKKSFKINKSLIWDYDFRGKLETEEFKKWYVACVLSRGNEDDIRQLGLWTIRQYLPSLNLSRKIRKFWEWYFAYADSHGVSGKTA